MAEVSFDDLIPKGAQGDRDVSFDDLIPDKKKKKARESGNAATDIPHEISEAFKEGARNFSSVFDEPSKKPQLERFLNTPNLVTGSLQMAMSPLTGLARSVGGHGLAYSLHQLGKLFPDRPDKPTYDEIYEEAKPGVDRAMMGLGARGGPGSAQAITRRAPNPVTDASNRLRDLGMPVDVPQAIASDSMAVQRAGQGISHVPLIGNSVVRANERLGEGLGSAAESVAGEYGTGSGQNVGGRIGLDLSRQAEAETAAARAAAETQDAARTQAWEQSNLDSQRAIAAREAQATHATREAVGDVNPQDMGESVISAVRSAEREAHGRKEALYTEAGQTEGTIATQAAQGARGFADQALTEAGLAVEKELTPAALSMLNELDGLGRLNIPNAAKGAVVAPSDAERVGVTLQGIEQTRKRLNSMRGAAANDADRNATRTVMNAFDDWQAHAMQNHLLSGDPDALAVYQRARAANRDWRQRFGYNERDDADRILNRIATENVTPNEIANWLIGSGKIGSKGVSSRLLQHIEGATGSSPAVIDPIRGAVWNRLREGKPEAILDFLSGTGRDLANRLYTPAQRGVMRSYVDTVRNAEDARAFQADLAKSTKPTATEVQRGPIQELADRVLGSGQKSDEQIFAAIDSYAKSGNRGDLSTLGKLLRAMPEDERGNLASAIIRNAVKGKNGEFSPDVFASNWSGKGGYTPEAKTLLFGNAGPHRKALDDIATISEKFKDVRGKFGNPAGTAQTLNFRDVAAATLGAIGSAYAGVLPLKVIAGGVSGWTLARMLASPAGASSIARWTRAYNAMAFSARHRPTIQTNAVMQDATRALSREIDKHSDQQ